MNAAPARPIHAVHPVTHVDHSRDFIDVNVINGELVLTDSGNYEVEAVPLNQTVRIPAGAYAPVIDRADLTADVLDFVEWDSLDSVSSGDLDDFEQAIEHLDARNPLAYLAERMVELLRTTTTPGRVGFIDEPHLRDVLGDAIKTHLPE